jgi:hypothetical protein
MEKITWLSLIHPNPNKAVTTLTMSNYSTRSIWVVILDEAVIRFVVQIGSLNNLKSLQIPPGPSSHKKQGARTATS